MIIVDLLFLMLSVTVANDLQKITNDTLEFPGEHPPIGFTPSNDTLILLLDNGTWKYSKNDNDNGSAFGALKAMNYTV